LTAGEGVFTDGVNVFTEGVNVGSVVRGGGFFGIFFLGGELVFWDPRFGKTKVEGRDNDISCFKRKSYDVTEKEKKF